MSEIDWANVRNLWENDTRKGFTWLCKESGLSVTPQAVRKRADREQWAKKVTEVTPRKSNHDRVTSNPKRWSAAAEGKGGVTDGVTQGVGGLFGNINLTGKQNVFVMEFLKDFNASRAARAAGYSKDKNGNVDTGAIVNSPAVQKAIRDAISKSAGKLGLDADEIMKLWADIVDYDANELVQVRRVPCPYCWAEVGEKQYTLAVYEKEKEAHEKKRQRLLMTKDGEDIGEFPSVQEVEFIDMTKGPNPECTVCHGVGSERLFTSDTRHLSPIGKRIYCGAKMMNGRVEVLMLSKERAMENLAKALGVFAEKEEEKTVEQVSGEQLLKIYNEKMRIAKERQAAVNRERGLDGVVDAVIIEKGGE